MKNIEKYDSELVASLYTKKELAKVLVATTCYDETISQQYSEFTHKDEMIDYLIIWLDDCFDDLGYTEDLIEFINNNK